MRDSDNNGREGGAGREVYCLQKVGFAGGGILGGHQSTEQSSAIRKKTSLNMEISKHAPIPEQVHFTRLQQYCVHPFLLSPGHVEEVYNIDDILLLPYRNIYFGVLQASKINL